MSAFEVFALMASISFLVLTFWSTPILWRHDKILAGVIALTLISAGLRAFMVGIGA